MKCKCSLNNNYEVIGLCDIKEFNKRIRDFQDESWTQITIPERLKIPSNKPPIKNITKVFLNIKLTSNKIIKTPSSDIPNIEGLKLTGKILLVTGTICQNIMYVSDTVRNSIHSVKFDVPFNTYIVVDKESKLENDSFCVYPCVEDVFITRLDERTISKSVTLFLFAHRIVVPAPIDPPIDPPLPEIRMLPNAYIFKTFDTNKEMAKIEFDVTNKKLIVTSTGDFYTSNKLFEANNNGTAFRFELKDSNGTKASESISEIENMDAFKDALNSFGFEFSDKITVLAKDASKLILTNFPRHGENYEVPHGREQTFEITQSAIIPSVLPYKIIVKSKNNEEVLSIQFNKENTTFIVSSTGIIPDPSSTNAYFTLMIKSDLGNKFLEGILNSNEDGSNFKTAINNKPFRLTPNKLILICKDRSKIEILNYPNAGDTYIPNVDINIFSIANNVLNDELLSSMIKILGDNNEEVSSIAFNKSIDPVAIAISTGAIGTRTLLETIPYVEFLNYTPSGTIIFSQILGKKDASEFVSKFTNRITSTGPIRLFNKIANKIIITNYKGQDEYRIGEEPEFFKPIRNSLIPHNLNYNKIRLKNRDNSSVLYIYFDKLGSNDIYIEAYSTGKVNRDTDSFSFKITDSTGAVKNNIQGSVNKNDTADSIYISPFPNAPNISKRFNFGDILVLDYSDKSLVEIFDFPFTQNPYNPTGVSSQKFRINSNGLVPIDNKMLKNAFIFKNLNGDEMARAEFNITEKKIILTSSSRFYGGGAEIVFRFTLRNSTGNKISASVRANENIENFKNALNNFDFDFNDEIVIFSKDTSKVVLTNSPNTGDIYEVPNGTDQMFTITPNSIMLPIPQNLLPNKITVKSKNDEEVLSIQFDKITSRFIVSSTGVIPDPSSTDDYFTIIIPTFDGQLDLQYSLKSNEDGSKFKAAINNKIFVYTLILVYKDKSKIEISNYPNFGDLYIPNLDSNVFEITKTSLIEGALPNKIKILGDNDEEVSLIQIIAAEYGLLGVSSTGTIGTNNLLRNIPYVEFLHYKNDAYDIFAQILGKDNAFQFASKFNGKTISSEKPIRLFNKIPNRIIITDYKGQSEYRIGEEPEFFKSDKKVLLPYDLNYNKIRLKNMDDSSVLYIYFDKIDSTTIYIEPYSTGKENLDSTSFSFKITDSSGIVKNNIQGNLNQGETANNINIAQNPDEPNISKEFNFGDILVLEYSDKSLVEIYDFPFTSASYNPTGSSSQKFLITEDGLKLTSSLENVITFKGFGDAIIATIEFNSSQKKLIVDSTGNTAHTGFLNEEYFAFVIKDSNGVIKEEASVQGQQNANSFSSTLNEQEFEYGDIIQIRAKENNRVLISNFINIGNTVNPFLGEDNFTITQDGLKEAYTYLPNIITFKGLSDSLVSMIRFDKDSKLLSVASTRAQAHTGFGDKEYFAFILKDSNKIIKEEVSVKGNENAKKFRDTLNSKPFEYNYIITLRYQEANRVLISNYPNYGMTFNPPYKTRDFRITLNGLIEIIPSFLNNTFIFKRPNNSELARIEFNTTDKKIIATSKDIIYGGGGEIVFRFTLRNSRGNKISVSLPANERINNFINTLNNVDFDFNDEIVIFSKDASKVVLTNSPNTGKDYEVPNGTDQMFTITPNSIMLPIPSNLLPNKITVKSKNDEEVLNIQFNKQDKTFMVSSTGIVPDPSLTGSYFTLIIKNSFGNTVLQAILNSNEDGSNFKTGINNKSYLPESNYLILIYKDKSKIEISNYPNNGDAYIPDLSINIIKITDNGLIDGSATSKIKILGDNNEEVSSIAFPNISNPEPVAISTGAIGTNNLLETIPYAEFLHYQSSGINIFAQILGKKDASNFISEIQRNTSIGPIRLFNKIPNRIIITNYKGQDEYKIGEEPEFFKQLGGNLDPYDLNYNKIRLKNIDNSSVLFIYFDKVDSTDVYIQPYSTGKENLDTDSFSFKITDLNGTVKNNIQGSVNKGDTADSIYISRFPNSANFSNRFDFGDILTLEYSDKSLVEIFDFPFTSLPYNPIDPLTQKFLITKDGLKAIGLSANVITFKGFGNDVIATVKFNNSEKQLIVESTGTIAHDGFSNQEYFAFILKDSSGNIKAEASVQGQENANNFRDTLNEEEFEYGDIIEIKSKENDRVLISNFIKFDNTFNPFFQEDNFKITEAGLEVGYEYLSNIITFQGSGDRLISIIRFNKDLKILSVGNANKIANHNFGEQEYFAFVLKDSNGVIKEEASVKGNENASNFRNILNSKPFEFGYFITLRYQEPNRVLISNFPNPNETFNPPNKTKDFKITENGFEDATAPTPPPPIISQKLLSSINIRNINGDVMVKVEFDIDNKKLVATSTGVMDNSKDSNSILCALTLNSSRTKLKYSTNHSDFIDTLNNKSFEFGDVLIIHYFASNHIIIDNYPNEGESYVPRSNLRFEHFKIESFGLVKLT